MEVQQKQFAQKRPAQLVYLELGAGNGGMVTSLSEEGFRFRAVSPVRPDAQMQFAFSLDGNQRLEGLGVVEDLEDDCKSGGMRFTEVSEQFRMSLKTWLHAESSNSSAGRELTPAASAPLDTMEKIRQELRAGYPRPDNAKKPTQPVATASHAESSSSDLALHESSVPAAPSLEKKPKRIAAPASTLPLPAEPKLKPKPAASPPAASTPSDVQSLRRLFHDSVPSPSSSPVPSNEPSPKELPSQESKAQSEPAQDKAEINSAFLRPTGPDYHRPFMPVRAVLNDSPAHKEIRSDQTARPYIPPLEESFEQAWERAKLSAPPESPQLSRAAASGIITVALLVILGALAYNFRADIGTTFILLGRSISGQNQSPPPVALPQAQSSADSSNTQQEQKNPGADVPTQNDANSKSATDKPSGAAQSTNETPAREKSTHASQPPASAADTHSKPAKTESPVNPGNPQSSGDVPAQSVVDTTSKPAPIESPTGEAEFNAARDMLHGPNRQVDLRRSIDFLWSAVRKGYVPAEVTLADLYRRGDGVPKNCDQAAVLLTAASKKGSADARRMLELMAEQGCQ